MVKQWRQYGLLLLLLITQNTHIALAEDNAPNDRLIILNWAEYLDPNLVKQFEQAFHTRVSEIYFESDEHRTQILLDNDAEGFDIILTSGIDIEPYIHHGWLAPLDLTRVPNRRHISKKWLNAYPYVNTYGVPYFWGTTGILYRRDHIPYKITSWMDLFKPAPALKGKVGMFSDSNEMISIALKALGYSINEGSAKALKQAADLLRKQKHYVRSYQYISVGNDSEILSGDLWITVAYSGDALAVMEKDPLDQLAFTIPEEGTNLWADYLTVGAKSHRPDLAHAFINFINQPENAAQLAVYTNYATPNNSAKKWVSEDYLSNPIIFPSEDVLMKSEQFRLIPPKQLKQRNAISAKLIGNGR
ncbi:spermidine/putrescine ABC transporter substrate-binding protein [Vibrio albus]|uniref:Putrescine-binding periplasmic protein n=1 Tax=Vibrio albus TaxID=2200953 RepID=A0A2U3B9E6_9VIBR|nr:spermidine/putrescine ABC transporter substrate-binding protein [Vibrio albus]PWI33365.1 spermidine/putrescine ABC transporter substrate-binding protein [Vibrio albus]